MVRKTAMGERPSIIPATVGGAVATILLSALVHLAPAAGLPFLDPFRLAGGVFTANPDAAMWLGFALFLVGGWFVLPPLLAIYWNSLPGAAVGFGGALVKGVLAGAILFVVGGALYGLLGELNRVEGVANPGWFALEAGAGGAAVLLVAHVAYGVTLALIAAMSRNISPADTIGWSGHGAGRAA